MPVDSSLTQRWRWPRPSKRRLATIVATALGGAVLIWWARYVDDEWLSSVMIEIGATVFLIAPVLWMENALRRKLSEIDVALRTSVTGLSAVRELLPYGQRRTEIFDLLLNGVRERAAAGGFRPAQITTLLSGDGDGRTVALAAMVGAPSLVDGAAVARSIRWADTNNEQYYALRAAQAGWNSLTSGQRASILDAVDGDPRGISSSQDRSAIADALREAARPPA